MSPRHRLAALVLACAFALAGTQAPPPHAAAPAARTLLAVGDIASCASNGDEQTAALVSRIPGTIAVLGDIAYENGSESDFANCFEPSWGKLVPRIKAALGNHEYNTGRRRARVRALRLAAERLVQLLARRLARDRAQLELQRGRRLRARLAAVRAGSRPTSRRTPPAARSRTGTTRASARASTAPTSTYAPFWDILARAKADLVLQGHDHDYERFAPLKGIRSFVVGTGGKSHYPDPAPAPRQRRPQQHHLRRAPADAAPDRLRLEVPARRQRARSPTRARAAAAEPARYGAGTEVPLGTNASCTTRSTFARRPSSTGARPASSRRHSSTRPCDAQRHESEVLEEVAREHGAVDEEPHPRRLALRVAVGERLERLRALIARLADRGEEQRLLDPLRALAGQIGAGDEHRVVRRRAGRAGRPRAGRIPTARTASTRAPSRRRRSRSSPTRPTPPRPARSSAPWRPSCCRATATTRTRGTPTARWRSSPASGRRRATARLRRLPAAARCRRRRRPPTPRSDRPSARGTPRRGSARRHRPPGC